jgi:hypothetical protein
VRTASAPRNASREEGKPGWREPGIKCERFCAELEQKLRAAMRQKG